MLQRGYTAAQALEGKGIIPEIRHKDVYSTSRSDALIIRIDSEGLPISFEARPADEFKRLVTLRDGQQNSFPGHKIRNPEGRGPERRPERIGGDWERLKSRNKERADQLEGDDVSPFRELLLRFAECGMPYPDWHRLLVEKVNEAITRGELDSELAPVRNLLEGEDAQVYFDLPPEDLGDRTPVAHPDTGTLISRCLIAQATSARHGVCSISGVSGGLVEGSFPVVNLPYLGQQRLWSLDTGSRSNQRYGTEGDAAITVAEETAYRAQGSLQWLTSETRKGQTWSGLDGDMILVSYLPDAPAVDGPLAELLSTDAVEGQWVEISRSVHTAFRAHAAIRPESLVEIFAVEKLGKSGARVNYVAAPTVGELFDSLDRWSTGVSQLPFISIPQRRRDAPALEPVTPGLGALVPLTSRRWIRGGAESQKGPGCSWTESLDLFLHSAGAGTMLGRLVTSSMELLWRTAAALHSSRLSDLTDRQREETVRYSAAIGTVLGIMRPRGTQSTNGGSGMNVMRSLGQMLAMADVLHREYCKQVRNGQMPPQLMGAALCRMAGKAPHQALALMNERLPVYSAWADTAREGAGLARWAISQMGELAKSIEMEAVPRQPNPEGRAELMLGYLSRKAMQKKTDDSTDVEISD